MSLLSDYYNQSTAVLIMGEYAWLFLPFPSQGSEPGVARRVKRLKGNVVLILNYEANCMRTCIFFTLYPL